MSEIAEIIQLANQLDVFLRRNIAVILEVAAMNYREKKLGYNAAYELLQRLGMMDIDTNWDTF